MTTELANRFIKYASVKEIRDAAHMYLSKVAQLVTQAGTLQQGKKSVLTYANELSDIFNELDHYRPPDHDSADRKYALMDRVYKLLQGVRTEFEGICSQLYNREHPLSFDGTVSQ